MRLETALQQEEERARGNARRKKASIEKEAREDTEQGEEQGTMAMESSGSSSLSVATQTDISAEEVACMEKRACESGSSKVPDVIKFYTGLPSYPHLTTVFNYLSSDLVESKCSALPLFQQFLITLMKLRLNVCDQDIAYRFGISQLTVSKNFRKWVNIMYLYMKPFIVWPGREEVLKTMPEAFKREFKKCICIIDCFEVFVNALVT